MIPFFEPSQSQHGKKTTTPFFLLPNANATANSKANSVFVSVHNDRQAQDPATTSTGSA